MSPLPSVPIDPDNGQPLVDLPPIVPQELNETAYMAYAPNDPVILAPEELCILRPFGEQLVDASGNLIVFFQSTLDTNRNVPGRNWWEAGVPSFGLLPAHRRPDRTQDTAYRYNERVVSIRIDDPEPTSQLPGYTLRRGDTYSVQLAFRGGEGPFAMDRVQAHVDGQLVLEDIQAVFYPDNTMVLATFTVAKSSGPGLFRIEGVQPVAFTRVAKVQVV
jgi:hypothetical protein